MSKPRRTNTSSHSYPRTARLNESLREVIAEELIRIDDERLMMLAITAIDVDPEMNRAIVYWDSLMGEDADDQITEALAEHRVRIQSAVGRQGRAKKTPVLSFRHSSLPVAASTAYRNTPSAGKIPAAK